MYDKLLKPRQSFQIILYNCIFVFWLWLCGVKSYRYSSATFATCDLSGSTIFFHIISQTARFSRKKLLNTICVLFFLQYLYEIFLILRRFQQDITVNVHRSSYEVPFIPIKFQWNSNSLGRFSKNPQIPNFVKTSPVRAGLLHANRQTDRQTDEETDRYDEAKSHFSYFTNAPKKAHQTAYPESDSKILFQFHNDLNLCSYLSTPTKSGLWRIR